MGVVDDDHSQLAGTVCVQYLLWAHLKLQILLSPVPHDHRSWIHAVLSIATIPKMSTDWHGASVSPSIRHIWLKRACNVCEYEGFSAVTNVRICFFLLQVKAFMVQYVFQYALFLRVCTCYQRLHLDGACETCQRPF